MLKALTNALDSGRLHHAYLFAGTRGVGKTTIARILAKALNCETGVVAEPSGAATTAALRHGVIRPDGPTVLVVSGGNVDVSTIPSLVAVV